MAGDDREPEVSSLGIVQIGEPVLRHAARAVPEDELAGERLRILISLMRDTMRGAPGVGLAAPPSGEPLRLAVIEDRREYLEGADPAWLAERERQAVPFYTIVNPELTVIGSDTVEFFEGCLSVAGFTALVPRARAVGVTFLDENGTSRTIEARGWHARILQHEIDHLNGTLYVDRMNPRSFMTTAAYARHWAKQPVDEVRRVLEKTVTAR